MSLAVSNCCSENVAVLAIVVAELQFRNVEQQVLGGLAAIIHDVTRFLDVC
jgi:hypothetical protein